MFFNARGLMRDDYKCWTLRAVINLASLGVHNSTTLQYSKVIMTNNDYSNIVVRCCFVVTSRYRHCLNGVLMTCFHESTMDS